MRIFLLPSLQVGCRSSPYLQTAVLYDLLLHMYSHMLTSYRCLHVDRKLRLFAVLVGKHGPGSNWFWRILQRASRSRSQIRNRRLVRQRGLLTESGSPMFPAPTLEMWVEAIPPSWPCPGV